FATMFPTISEAIDGARVSVGVEFFNRWMTPIGMTLLFLAGAAPLLAWRKTTRERLWNQFMIPLGCAAVTIAVLAVFVPASRALTPIFADSAVIHVFGYTIDLARLPISLINFGLCAFVFGSIGQEYIRGVFVRQRQTGSDPFTSLIGLVLAKRRKYGGYIVHLGVAVLFIGFAGKTYGRMIDRTIDKPLSVETSELTDLHKQLANERAHPTHDQDAMVRDLEQRVRKLEGAHSFDFGDYTFRYDTLIHSSDDHKDAVTAQVSVYRGRELIETVYPAKWDFHKGDGQMTTEVAIKVLAAEDVYVVLTGYDLDTNLANFRVYLNPLILWVWVGFLVMAFGTLVCLIPQAVVDKLQWKPRTRLGRAADVGLMIAIIAGLLAGLASQARADTPAEHVTPGMGMGQAGGGFAAQNRPNNDTAAKAMKELICTCGCARQDIYDCDCKTAADLRLQVMSLMGQTDASGKPLYDLTTEAGRQQAYDAVLAAFSKEYGGQVLATPKSKVSWLFPSLAAIGGLGLLVVVGRRWLSRGDATNKAQAHSGAKPAEDETYADKLDDELSKTD
ncbi:MAG: cytochrome c assembly protein, partial [Myxococcales bacterium]|nr:cytochrome c assembly protein [Myxococcales bacterium]